MKNQNPLCAIIIGPTFAETQLQISQVAQDATILEFRLDLFDFSQPDQIRQLKSTTNLPVIFTVRLKSHGGAFNGPENDRLNLFRELLKLNPAYIDLEYDSSPELFKLINPSQLICSTHNFQETPQDLLSLLTTLKDRPAAIYKMACMANSSLDALRMLHCVQTQSQTEQKIIGICLGEDGVPTRVLGNIFGNAFTYAAITSKHCVAPGQLDIETLKNIYHFHKHDKDTIPFGVIGNPIARSIGHLRHNESFRKIGVNAVYVKMRITEQHLEAAMELFPQLNFGGLSVTMPLKEKSMPYMSSHDPATKSIGALNTVVIRQNTMRAYNTDGEAAFKAILDKTAVKNKRVIMLGAGGAAKAMLYYLHEAGAILTILNRTLEKTKELGERYNGEFGTLDDFPKFADQGYDILINGTSMGRDDSCCPVSANHLLPGKVVMEVISVPAETPFVIAAKKKQCTIVYGMDMYERQAVKQLQLWFAP